MTTTSDLIKYVKIIEELKPGEKLIVRDGVIYVDSSPNPLVRWFNGDNRYLTLTHVHNIIENALLIGIPVKSQGLKNLQETYKDSKAISDSLNLLIQKIDATINEHYCDNPAFYNNIIARNLFNETH